MKNGVILIIFLCILLGVSFAVAEEGTGFKVIIHASNPTKQLSKQALSQLFLKKVTQWKDRNDAVFPVDLADNSLVRQKFSALIHGRDVASIKAYWQKQIFSGRGVPPEEKKTDAEVLQHVAEHSGAVGYISESAKIDAYQVKVLTVIDK